MLLRLWYTLATGLVRPRLGVLDECRVKLRVWPNDLDVNLHMNNSRYLLAMDLGRWDYGLRAGVLQPAFRRRWFPVVGSETLRFRRALDPFQRFELRRALVAWDEKWWWFEQRFEWDGSSTPWAGEGALPWTDRATCRPRRRSCAAGYARRRAPRQPEAIRLWQQTEEAERETGRPERP